MSSKYSAKYRQQKLGAKQEAFALTYDSLVRDGMSPDDAATLAAKRSDLGRNGPKELTKPRVAAYLEARRASESAVSVILHPPTTRDERASLLGEIARDKNYKTPDRLKAIELAGKMEGDYVERKEVRSAILVKNVKDMTDEELARFLLDDISESE